MHVSLPLTRRHQHTSTTVINVFQDTHCQWGVWSNLASKLRRGLDPSMLFPVSLSSSMVCTFSTWNLKNKQQQEQQQQQKQWGTR